VTDSANRSLVVGISSNVVDPGLRGNQLDGIGVYTQALIRSLESIGVRACRVGAPIVSWRGIRRPTQADIRLPVSAEASIAWSSVSGKESPLWRAVERSVDIYHATDQRIPRLRRLPVVATIYDAIPLMHPGFASARLRALKNWLMRASARNADIVIAISQAAADEIEAHYRIPRERIRVVHLGVAKEWFQDAHTARGGDPPRLHHVRPCYFLFVGTLQPRKNVKMLLQAYDRLDPTIRAEHQLVIAGRYGWGVEELRRELELRRADTHVLWLEYVDQNALRQLYREAAAFVFPSLAEGFGLPVLEALASGIPVVASDLLAVREAAGDHALFTSPDDPDALADAMRRALTVERSAPADTARRDWARRFDWQTCARRTYAVYCELV